MINPDNFVTLDYETDRIQPRPHFPPRAVGCSIKYGDAPSHYYAWGHPSGNNCTEEEGRAAVKKAWTSGRRVLAHHMKFDASVSTEGAGLPELPWQLMDDSMFLCYLADPHGDADLKGAAESWLGLPPDERDAIAEYLWENRTELQEQFDGPRISRDTKKETPQATKKSTGEWLSRCPGDLVGPYAEGDTDRAWSLFVKLYPLIAENGMLAAYNRERQVLPIFMENERIGIRVDVEALERDIKVYKKHRKTADSWLRERLQDPELNIDSDKAFAEALAENGIIDDNAWTLTETGQRSVSKKNLRPDMYNDEEVANAFGYRNRLGTCLKMFMEPWLAQAKQTGGTVHTNWNQTRGGAGGTRTGRPSTNSPNFLNISKNFEGRTDGYAHPRHLDVEALPLVRNYILADEGHVLIRRDFSGQELRVFAHFECGELHDAYLETPELDVHAMVGDKMKNVAGKEFERTRVKVVNFQSIYGGGIPALQRELNIPRPEAKEFKAFHDRALPGRVILNEEINRVVNLGHPIRTWGGRCYFPEEPRFVGGRMVDFKYKLLNYAVQGSAADLTKQAIIDWYNDPRRDPRVRLIVTVYDEILASCPVEIWEDQMRLLREIMNKKRLTVPMLSDGEYGESWGRMQKCA